MQFLIDNAQPCVAVVVEMARQQAVIQQNVSAIPRINMAVITVKILRQEADKVHIGLKAAGGIRDLESAEAMLAVGADRIGTSVGQKIVGAVHAK